MLRGILNFYRVLEVNGMRHRQLPDVDMNTQYYRIHLPDAESLHFSNGAVMMIATGTPTIDLSKLEVARFDGYEEFDHFTTPGRERCFACNSRKMLVRPIAATNEFTLLVATTPLENNTPPRIIPDTWLVYPRAHLTTFLVMPDNWTASVKESIRILGLERFRHPFCTSDNWGSKVGQTVRHGHTWIMKRGEGEEHLLSENIGMATMLLRIKMYGILPP